MEFGSRPPILTSYEELCQVQHCPSCPRCDRAQLLILSMNSTSGYKPRRNTSKDYYHTLQRSADLVSISKVSNEQTEKLFSPPLHFGLRNFFISRIKGFVLSFSSLQKLFLQASIKTFFCFGRSIYIRKFMTFFFNTDLNWFSTLTLRIRTIGIRDAQLITTHI